MDLVHDPINKVAIAVIYSEVSYRIKFKWDLVWEIKSDQLWFVGML